MTWKRPVSVLSALLSIVALAGPATGAHHEESDAALVAMEKALWEGWKNADGAPFEKHLVDGAITMVPAGMTLGKAENVAEITSGSCQVASYRLDPVTVHRPAPGVAILIYEATQDAACDGEKIPGRIRVSSVWVKKEGAWYSALYHESVPVE